MRGGRLIGRLPGVGEHVPEQEDQDPDGGAVQERLHFRRDRIHPADRQPEDDGQPRDGSQQRDLAR